MSVKILCAFYFTGLFIAFVPDTHGTICWDTTWYNSSSPGDHDGSDYETLTTSILNGICPGNKPVTAARCRDEKGEPFTGFKNDTGNHYIATCTVVTGLQCHPYNNTVGASCADFAIQYGCDCPTTTSSTNTGEYINTSSVVGSGSTGSSSESGSGESASGSGSTGSPIGSGSGGSASGSGSTGSPVGSGSVGNTSGSGSTGSSSGSGTTGSSSGSGSGGSTSGNGSTGIPIGSGSGEISSGSGSGSGSGGSGSGGDPNSEGGNSALGGSCPCRNGSQKTDFTFFPILFFVLLKLYLF